MCPAFNRRNHRRSYVSEVLQDLNAFIVNLAPNTGIDLIQCRVIRQRRRGPLFFLLFC